MVTGSSLTCSIMCSKMCPQPQCLTDMATDQPDQGNSSVELLPSQVTLGCIKLTISRQGPVVFVLFCFSGVAHDSLSVFQRCSQHPCIHGQY